MVREMKLLSANFAWQLLIKVVMAVKLKQDFQETMSPGTALDAKLS